LNLGIKAFKSLKNINLGNFARGATFTGTKSLGGFKGAIKNKSFMGGATTSIGATMAAPKITKTTLEKGTRNSTRRLSNSMISPSNV